MSAMKPFVRHRGVAAPLMRINIDTDAIIPSREMKRVSKEGLGDGLFANWRYNDVARREENPDFVLNREPFRQARILLAGANFGCGSSREHAVWALRDFGMEVVIAPSFGSIFQGNCVRNGLLPVVLEETVVEALAEAHEREPWRQLSVDLEKRLVAEVGNRGWSFEIDEIARDMLLQGLDPISRTLQRDESILDFIRQDRHRRPWIHRVERDHG